MQMKEHDYLRHKQNTVDYIPQFLLKIVFTICIKITSNHFYSLCTYVFVTFFALSRSTLLLNFSNLSSTPIYVKLIVTFLNPLIKDSFVRQILTSFR